MESDHDHGAAANHYVNQCACVVENVKYINTLAGLDPGRGPGGGGGGGGAAPPTPLIQKINLKMLCVVLYTFKVELHIWTS